MLKKCLALVLVGAFTTTALAEFTAVQLSDKQIFTEAEYLGTTRDEVNIIGTGPIDADTCPADAFGTIPFAVPGDGFILPFAPTCGGTNAFEEDVPGACGDGAYGSGGVDQIYSFDTPTTGIYTWDTCFFPAGFDTSLMIREETGGGCPGDEVTCDGDSCNVGSFESGLTVLLTAGTTYYGILDGWSAGDCNAAPTDTVMFLDALPCASDAECDDGVFCNGVETCNAGGTCDPGSYPCLSYQTCDEGTQTCVDPDDCTVWQGEPTLPGSFSPQCFNGCLGSGLADDWEFALDGSFELISYQVMSQARNLAGAAGGCVADEPVGSDYTVTTYLATVDPATCGPLAEIPGTRCDNMPAGTVGVSGDPGDVSVCEPNGGLPTGVILPDGDQDNTGTGECGVDVYVVFISNNEGAGHSLGTADKLIGGPGVNDEFGQTVMFFEDCDAGTGLPLGTWAAGAFSAPTRSDFRNANMCVVPQGTCCTLPTGTCSITNEDECDALGGTFTIATVANGNTADCGDDPDGDGVVDLCGGDNCPDTANPGQEDCNNDGVGDACSPDCNNNGIDDDCEADGDGDGVIDDCDPCPLDNPDDPDNDGFCSSDEECPLDPDKQFEGQCGCGVPDTDDDGDGTANCNDLCAGVDDDVFAPECDGKIPTVSEWGLVVLSLLLLVAAKVYFGRREVTA